MHRYCCLFIYTDTVEQVSNAVLRSTEETEFEIVQNNKVCFNLTYR